MSPEWDSNGKINLTPTAPNMPSDPGKTLGAENAIRYQVNGAASYIGEIYALEASAAIDAGGVGEDGNASRKNATCLIVMGKMIERSCSWRLLLLSGRFYPKGHDRGRNGGRVYAFDAKLQICC